MLEAQDKKAKFRNLIQGQEGKLENEGTRADDGINSAFQSSLSAFSDSWQSFSGALEDLTGNLLPQLQRLSRESSFEDQMDANELGEEIQSERHVSCMVGPERVTRHESILRSESIIRSPDGSPTRCRSPPARAKSVKFEDDRAVARFSAKPPGMKQSCPDPIRGPVNLRTSSNPESGEEARFMEAFSVRPDRARSPEGYRQKKGRRATKSASQSPEPARWSRQLTTTLDTPNEFDSMLPFNHVPTNVDRNESFRKPTPGGRPSSPIGRGGETIGRQQYSSHGSPTRPRSANVQH